MITYAREPFDTFVPELKAMLPAQRAYTDGGRNTAVNWDLYAALSQRGFITIWVARENGRAIGYAGAYVGDNPNAYATTDDPAQINLQSQMVVQLAQAYQALLWNANNAP